jgi:hypothetical protein
MADDVSKAIAAAAADEADEHMVTAGGTIDATGRPFQLLVPADLSPLEALAIVGYLVGLPERLEKRNAGAASRILVPRH